MAQRDDERYPTLAGPGELLIGSSLPEAVLPRPPEMLATSHDKMLSISSAEMGQDLQEPPASPRDRICGLRKTTFWLSLILAIAVIGAAVGGGVGGSLASKNNHSEQVSTPSTSPTSLSESPTATGTSGTPSATIRNAQAIAAAGMFTNGGSTVNLQVFYQDMASGNITYYLYLSGVGWQNPQNASLLVTPKNGTSLAATATADSAGNTYVNLFYLSDQGDIIQANLTCAARSVSCSTGYNGIISTNVQYPVNASSGLAAVYGGPYFTWRVYYYDISGYLSELDGDNAETSGWTSGVVGGKALHGSSIAVALQPPYGLNVFYVDSFSQLLVSTVYQYGVGWGTPSPLSIAGPTWNPTSSLAAIFEGTPTILRAYYVGTDKEVYEYVDESGVWLKQPDQSPVWGTADASIAGVGWADQVRLYYMTGGVLVEAALGNTTWTKEGIS